MPTTSYAQSGEDLQIAYLLGKRDNVSYIDVGCLWPVAHSNTYFFYERGGSGLAVDPNPTVEPAWLDKRPRDVFVNSAVAARPGRLTYRRYGNPVFNTFSAERADALERQSATAESRRLVETEDVEVQTLGSIVRAVDFASRCDGALDVLSVDVEGLELEVLEGYDFGLLRPRLVVCEYLRRRRDEKVEESRLAQAMGAKGYWIASYTGHDLYFMDASS